MAIRTKDKISDEITRSITSLDRWITANGWAGYDPYDIKGHPVALKLIRKQTGHRPLQLIRGGLLSGIDACPRASRNLLGVRKQTNAKAMGLFAAAYLSLFQQLKDESYLRKANQCLTWLAENKSQGYAGACWGYPFDWQSLVLIPKGTPSAVVSSICGHAFWGFCKFTGDKRYLDVCQSICEFFIKGLNIDYVDENRLCFSYTPLDRFHVHNANLFAAEFLIRVGSHLDNREFCHYGSRALNYTLDAQNADGSFYYWALSDLQTYGIAEATAKSIDHYHTGFILRSLYDIYMNTDDDRVLNALTKGYEFYRHNLFQDRGVPKLTPDSIYPVNIHSCAEAILCMSALSGLFPDALEYALNAFMWTTENMQDKDGHFYYVKTTNRVNKMPYIRWGQAWMIRGLSELLASLHGQGR